MTSAGQASGYEGKGINRGMITASILTATLMTSLDLTIANVALPHIQGSVSASADQITWVLTSYIIAAAIMTPTASVLSERFGRKNVFLVAVTGFTVTSALCGIAQNLPQIVIFRLLQGICGAPLIPLAQAVLMDINPPEEQGQALALWGMVSMVAPIMGPVVGGWLTDHLSWRWVFYINLPIGVLALAGIWVSLPTRTQRHARPFDLLGFLFLAAGVGSAQLMLDRGQGQDWFSAPEIWIEGSIAVIAFYLCAVQTLTAKRPFISRALFRDPNFLAATIFGMAVGVLMFATTSLLPPMIETLLGYPVTQAGLVMAPRGFGTLMSTFLVGRLMSRFDPRLILVAGLAILALSMEQMSHFSLLMPGSSIVVSGFIQGFGMGLLFVPLTVMAFSTLPADLRAEGAGIFTLLRNVGSSVGISILSAVQIRNMAVSRQELGGNLAPGNPAVSALGRAIDLSSPASISGVVRDISRQAAMISYLDAFRLIMFIALGCIPLLIFLRKPKPVADGELHTAVE